MKTIRFYSDTGIVPRTLRDLGLDLAVIRQVLDREISVPEVAAAHASALEVQTNNTAVRQVEEV